MPCLSCKGLKIVQEEVGERGGEDIWATVFLEKTFTMLKTNLNESLSANLQS